MASIPPVLAEQGNNLSSADLAQLYRIGVAKLYAVNFPGSELQRFAFDLMRLREIFGQRIDRFRGKQPIQATGDFLGTQTAGKLLAHFQLN